MRLIMKKELIFILTLGFAFGANSALSRTTKVEDILNKIPKSVDIDFGGNRGISGGSPTTKRGHIAVEIGKSGIKLSDLFKKTAKGSVGKSSLVNKYRASANSSKVDRSIRNYAHSARENERVFSKSGNSTSKKVSVKGIFDIIIEEKDGYLVPKVVNLETEKKGSE
jgi:hypothetical protein